MDLDSSKQTMIDNLPKNTGKSLEECWTDFTNTN